MHPLQGGCRRLYRVIGISIEPSETRGKVVANLDMLTGKRVSRLPKKHANIQL